MIHTDKWPVATTPDGVVHFNWPLIQQHAEAWNSTDTDVSSIAYVLMYLRKENNTLTAENAALTAAVERVRALHVGKRVVYPNWEVGPVCVVCNTWPCPTLRALEGTV